MKMDHSYAVIQPLNKDNVEMVILQDSGSILQLTYDHTGKLLCTDNEMVFVQLPMNEPLLNELPKEADVEDSSQSYSVAHTNFIATTTSEKYVEERFRDLFPKRYETKLVSHEDDYHNSGEYFHVRVALKSKKEFVEWLKLHQNQTGITYRVLKTTRCEGKRSVYKAKYRCQHNTLAHLRKSTKCPSKKHTACPAYLSVTIKAVPKLEKCKDPYLPYFPAIIDIYHNHNHPVHKTSAEVNITSSPEEGSDENFSPLSNSSNESHQIVGLHLEDDRSGKFVSRDLIKTDITPLLIRDPDLQDLEDMFKEFVHNVKRCYDSYPIEFHFAISKAKENYKRLTTDISLLNCLMEFGNQGFLTDKIPLVKKLQEWRQLQCIPTEDVTKMITFSKLKEDEITDEVQCITFVNNINENNIILMELDNSLLNYVTEGNSLIFRGGMNEHAVLCTNNATYAVKVAETSNLLLLLPELSYPKECSCSGLRSIQPREVTGMFHNYLELTPSKPKLKKLRSFLERNPFSGTEREDPDVVKYTMENLLGEVQASEVELKEGLKQMEAICIEDHWRFLEFDYKWRLLTYILNFVEENSWHYTNVPKQLVISTLAELEPQSIIEQFFDHISVPSGIHSDEGQDLCRLNEDKICQIFAEVLLRQTAKFSLKEFLEAWTFSVPSGMKPDLKQLRGLVLVEPHALAPTISYFPVWTLPESECERFNFLFKKRQKWTFDDICPFIEDLATEKVNVNGLLTKYARLSSLKGVQCYTSKRPIT